MRCNYKITYNVTLDLQLFAIHANLACERWNVKFSEESRYLYVTHKPYNKPMRTRKYYKHRIIIALDALGDRNGSSFDSIKEHIQEQVQGKKWLNYKFDSALKKMVTEGDFVQMRRLYKYSQAFLDHRAYVKELMTPNPLVLDENGKWSQTLYMRWYRKNLITDEQKACEAASKRN